MKKFKKMRWAILTLLIILGGLVVFGQQSGRIPFQPPTHNQTTSTSGEHPGEEMTTDTTSYGTITGRVVDFWTGEAVPNVLVEIWKGKIAYDFSTNSTENGLLSTIYGPWIIGEYQYEIVPGGDSTGITTYTDNTGLFTVRVPLPPNEYPNYFGITYSKEGYSTQEDDYGKYFVDGVLQVGDLPIKPLTEPNLPKTDLDRYHRIRFDYWLLQSRSGIKNPDFSRLREIIKNKIEVQENHQSAGDFSIQQRGSCDYTVPNKLKVWHPVNGYNNCNGYTSSMWGQCDEMYVDEFVGRNLSDEFTITDNIEALQAHAVASRTYALRKNADHIPANCGAGYESTATPIALNAAQETHNIVLLGGHGGADEGDLIDAKYSARCNGDYTLPSERGTWNPYASCNQYGNSVSYLKSVSCSGHSNCDDVSGESPCCQVIQPNGSMGNIYGHGVGLCQRGTKGFADQGKDYAWILHHYYTNVCIANENGTGNTCTDPFEPNNSRSTATRPDEWDEDTDDDFTADQVESCLDDEDDVDWFRFYPHGEIGEVTITVSGPSGLNVKLYDRWGFKLKTATYSNGKYTVSYCTRADVGNGFCIRCKYLYLAIKGADDPPTPYTVDLDWDNNPNCDPGLVAPSIVNRGSGGLFHVDISPVNPCVGDDVTFTITGGTGLYTVDIDGYDGTYDLPEYLEDGASFTIYQAQFDIFTFEVWEIPNNECEDDVEGYHSYSVFVENCNSCFDLQITDVATTLATMTLDQVVSVTIPVTNVGNCASPEVNIQIIVSPDQILGMSGEYVVVADVLPAVESGETHWWHAQWKLPQSQVSVGQTVYVFVREFDPDFWEHNTTNNTTMAPVTIVNPSGVVDLQFAETQAYQPYVCTDPDRVRCDVKVKNNGSFASFFTTMDWWLSTNQTWENTDDFVYALPIPTIQWNEYRWLDWGRSLTLPSTCTPCYLIGRIDPQGLIDEGIFGESNNTISIPIWYNPAPDVYVTAVTTACEYASIQFTATGVSGTHPGWHTAILGPNGIEQPKPVEQSFSVLPGWSGWYTPILWNGLSDCEIPVGDSVWVDQFTQLSVYIPDVDCSVQSTLSAVVVTGEPPYTYQWTTGSVSAGTAVSSPGTYTITVADNRGCTKVVSHTVTSIYDSSDVRMTQARFQFESIQFVRIEFESLDECGVQEHKIEWMYLQDTYYNQWYHSHTFSGADLANDGGSYVYWVEDPNSKLFENEGLYAFRVQTTLEDGTVFVSNRKHAWWRNELHHVCRQFGSRIIFDVSRQTVDTEYRFNLVNALGQVMWSSTQTLSSVRGWNLVVDMDELLLPAGVYYLHVYSGNATEPEYLTYPVRKL